MTLTGTGTLPPVEYRALPSTLPADRINFRKGKSGASSYRCQKGQFEEPIIRETAFVPFTISSFSSHHIHRPATAEMVRAIATVMEEAGVGPAARFQFVREDRQELESPFRAQFEGGRGNAERRAIRGDPDAGREPWRLNAPRAKGVPHNFANETAELGRRFASS